MIDVVVVIVGFNSTGFVKRCLTSLAAADWSGLSYKTVYVDNASADASVEMVRTEFPYVRIIVNERNAGFSFACNQGAAAVDSRYIYLLNNDTVVLRNSVRPLVEFLDRTPTAALAGNRLLNPDLSDQWSARRFPKGINALFGRRTLLGRWFAGSRVVKDYLYKEELTQGRPFRVDWVPGSCSMVRRAAYEQVHGVPEDIHYWGDAVFCDRLKKRGWEVYVSPEATLIHEEGHGSGPKTESLRRWLISDFHNGAYRFYCEHYGLAPWNPARWLVGAGLRARAQWLIAAGAFQRRRLRV